MELTSLTAISPLDGRYSDKTEKLRSIVSEYGLIFYRLRVEIEWLIALASTQKNNEMFEMYEKEVEYLNQLLENFNETEAQAVKKIEKTTNHDVKAIEYYLRDQLNNHPSLKKMTSWIHFGCTSEDINNLSYALMVKKTRDEIIAPALQEIVQAFSTAATQFAAIPMLSRTHGQAATPTTLGKEFKNFAVRLETQLHYFLTIPIMGKCNGAVGNFNAHLVAFPEIDWQQVSKRFVESLGLQWNAYTTQIEPHDHLAQLFYAFSNCNTILIDFCRDIWGYIALHYFSQKKSEHEVGSSTMPHKINPIDFENAEGNLGLCIALSTHLSQKLPISRWQRDLTDSTVLRNIGSVFAYALIAYQSLLKGLTKLIPNETLLLNELNQHWEILAEPIQMVMRRYGITDAYEQLKKVTRGETITQQQLHDFIKALDIPKKAKDELLLLTPSNYLGIAVELAKDTDYVSRKLVS